MMATLKQNMVFGDHDFQDHVGLARLTVTSWRSGYRMEQVQDFATLMQRLREGDQEAGRELFERCGPRILFIIRKRMNEKLRSQYDSADFSQAVWTSFFTIPPDELTFASEKELTSYLATMARNKVIDGVRKRTLPHQKDMKRERSLDGSVKAQAAQVPTAQPSASQVFVAEEEWAQMQARVPAHKRPILELLRQGYSQVEIARKLNMDEKTIRRLLKQVAPRELGS
jgi:RNA polymerase sigma factor (sigma-70 family)